ncbi:MAG: hypothetical protein II837_05775 [Treponema sp.]|nr:hypothetical protein [Treponema sp.]
MMDLFETKFLYLDWDDRLKGKKGFVGTDIHSLRNMVNDTNRDLDDLTCLAKYKDDLPAEGNFGAFGIRWPVAYYDPNYTQKIAYARGRQIQCRHGEFEHWEDCDMPSWYEDYEYREKPEIWYVWKDLGDRIHVTLRQDMANAEIFLRGNRQECKDYAIEKFCKKCRREDSPCYIDECDGFEPSTEKTCCICRCRENPPSSNSCRSCGENRDNWTRPQTG